MQDRVEKLQAEASAADEDKELRESELKGMSEDLAAAEEEQKGLTRALEEKSSDLAEVSK